MLEPLTITLKTERYVCAGSKPGMKCRQITKNRDVSSYFILMLS